MLPAAASLKKQGANNGATTAFLIATPESGVDSIAITYALLDPVMTIVRPVAAFVTAISAGFLENIIDKPTEQKPSLKMFSGNGEQGCDGGGVDADGEKKQQTVIDKTILGLKYGAGEVWGDIVVWFFAGLLLAGIITALIPDDMMASYLGGGLQSMVIMLFFGVPIYICATASTPVAAALILKGVSPGAALVFLLAGPATNVTSLSTMYGILGKKATFRYLLVLSSFALLFGLAVDQLYLFSGVTPQATIGEASELIPNTLKQIATIVLLLLSLKPLWLRLKGVFSSPASSPAAPLSSFPEHASHSVTNSDCGCNSHPEKQE